jgi:serine/threonine-protein kinase
MMGSPLYMSPEQFRSAKKVDTRTDIWALGAILYELVTGKPPFSAPTVTELAIKIAIEPLPSPALFIPSLPPGLVEVITTCLEKEPEQRFRDVAALAQALMPFAPQGTRAAIERVASILHGPKAQTEAPRAPDLPSNLPGVRTATGVHWTSPDEPRQKSTRARFAIAGSLALLGGLLGAWWKLSGGVAPAPAGPETAARTASATTAVPLPSLTAPSIPVTPAATVGDDRAPTPGASAASVPASMPAPSAGHKAPPSRPKSTLPAAPKAAARAEKSSPVAPARTAEAAKRAGASCDPPFYFDSAGNRIFKQECL